MKVLNGYYYCFSYNQYEHELCSVVEITKREAICVAARRGIRLYMVRYKNGVQQGKKKRIPVT